MNQKREYQIRQLKRDLLNARLMRQVTVLLPANVHDAIEVYAGEQGMGISPYVRNLLAEVVAEQMLLEQQVKGTNG